MKILVTGSDGFIGSHVVKLLEKEHHVDTLGRDTHLDKSFPSIDGYDVLIHLAARVGVKYFTSDYNGYKNNLNIDLNMIKALNDAKKKPFVFYASTSEVYGQTSNATEDCNYNVFYKLRGSYALEKANTEMMLRSCYDRFCALRFFNVSGDSHNDTHGHVLPAFVKKVLRGEPLVLHNNGEDVRTFCSVLDVAETIKTLVNMVDRADIPHVLNVGSHLSDNTVSIRHLASLVQALAGTDTGVISDTETQRIAQRIPNVKLLNSLGITCDTTLTDIVRSSIDYWRTNLG